MHAEEGRRGGRAEQEVPAGLPAQALDGGRRRAEQGHLLAERGASSLVVLGMKDLIRGWLAEKERS